MRQSVTAERLLQFMRALGRGVDTASRAYLTGGASAVLLDWRLSTIDVDVKFVPDSDEVLRRIPPLKEQFDINIELASPDDFIPELPGWEERSVFICQEGQLTFLHYDFYAQALSKIERGHTLDTVDVRNMFARGLLEPNKVLALFEAIEDRLYRYPAIHPARFRREVERVVAEAGIAGT
jgi:hypothetical protein